MGTVAKRVWFVHRTVEHEDLGRGMVTVAFVRGSGDDVWIGASWCHPKDTWNRKLGNKIAQGRAEHPRSRAHMTLPMGRFRVEDHFEAAISALDDFGLVPSWAVAV